MTPGKSIVRIKQLCDTSEAYKCVKRKWIQKNTSSSKKGDFVWVDFHHRRIGNIGQLTMAAAQWENF